MHPEGRPGRSGAVRSFVAVLILVLSASSPLRAHDPGLSTAQVTVGAAAVTARIGFAPSDLRTLLAADPSIPGSLSWTPADLASARPALLAAAPRLIELRSTSGAVAWRPTGVSLESPTSVMLSVEAPRPEGTPWTFSSRVLGRLPPGHRTFLSVTDGAGQTLLERLLSAGEPSADLTLAGPAQPSAPAPRLPGAWAFLGLGVEHIWTGYDHLLFLFGLLVVCRSFRSVVAIISCFTVAHSITLALAAFDVVQLPSRFVEPTIAATICYVGVENLLRRGAEPRGRWLLTFVFGLIHGFGFASVLRDLGVGAGGHGLIVPLFTFNLGVEVGQISIAAVALPALWFLRKREALFRPESPILSSIVAAAGLYWFLQRTVL
jgi:hydrogenase/urease accessory protein HupE